MRLLVALEPEDHAAVGRSARVGGSDDPLAGGSHARRDPSHLPGHRLHLRVVPMVSSPEERPHPGGTIQCEIAAFGERYHQVVRLPHR